MATGRTGYGGDALYDKVTDDHSQPGEDDNRRRRSFSMSFRSPTKRRNSVLSPPTSPATCEERIHYPVFNPQDPRHNPAIAPTAWIRSGCYFPRTPSPQKPIRWVQELPGRSLRKARSGLLALTNGMRNHPAFWNKSSKETVPDTCSICSHSGESLLPSGKWVFPTTVSEASTEEDTDFGLDIYRTHCNWPKPYSPSSWDSDDLCELRLSSSLALVSPSALSKVDLGPSMSPSSTLKKQERSGSSQEPDGKSQVSNISSRRQTIKWHDGYVRSSFPPTESNPSTTVASSACSTHQTDNLHIQQELKVVPASLSSVESSKSESHTSAALSGQEPEPMSRSFSECPESSTDEPSTAEYSRRESSASTDMSSLELSEELRQIAGAIERLTTGPDVAEYYASRENITNNASDNRTYPDCRTSMETSKQTPDSQREPRLGPDRSGRMNPSAPTMRTRASRWSTATSAAETDDLPDKDEFFLVDGKSNDFPPPRGDNALKAETRIVSDGSIHNGPGLDRDPGTRPQFVPEVIGPGGPRPRVVSRRDHRTAVERDGSDSTDEYISTYRILRRRFRSWSD